MQNRLFKILFIFLTLIFSESCENELKNKEKSTTTVNTIGNIVIILDKMPENWKYTMANGAYSHRGKHEIEYTVDGIIPTYYFSDYSKKKDTIIIKNVNHPIEIKHKFKGQESVSFIANPHDTLLFTYDEIIPIVHNLHDENDIYNYEDIIIMKIQKGGISNYTKYAIPYIFLREDHSFSSKSTDFEKTLTEYKKKYSILAKLELQKEKRLLDSLMVNDDISGQFFQFYDSRIEYRNKTIDIKQNENAAFEDYGQVDSLIQYSFYKDYLNAIVENGILKRVKTKESSNYSIPNPEAVYDSITANPHLSKGTKRYLSYVWLENIMNSSSNKNSISYFKQFKSQFKSDTLLIKYIIEKYKLDTSFSNDLTLQDKHGHETSLQQLLENNKGKILYVDFWASWCAPCRAAMSESHRLREKFKNRGVVFIYLALNDNQKMWEEAIQKEKLENYENSYIITNSKTSPMIDDLDIESIPRYVIFGAKNEILYKNAPSPNDKDIETLLNSLRIE